MSRKRRTIAIAVSVLVIGAFGYTVLREKPQSPEPRYNDTPLSEWLTVYHAPVAPGGHPSAAELAVRSIGTSALPLLLEWIRYELPPWRKTLLSLATWSYGEDKKVVFSKSLIEGESVPRAERAICGFAILNTNAVSAIPELEALMKNNKKPAVGLRAIWALGEIGGPAIHALTNALADTNQPHRSEIIEAIYACELQSPFYYGDTYKGACLPALIRTLEDPDDWMRRQARVNLFNLALHGLAPGTFTNASAK
jgi:HEAT repeat protein